MNMLNNTITMNTLIVSVLAFDKLKTKLCIINQVKIVLIEKCLISHCIAIF